MQLPESRGEASEAVFRLIGGAPTDEVAEATEAVTDAVNRTADILHDGDLQIALFVLYELHYRGVAGVDERWEWHPALLGVRSIIETAFEARLRKRSSATELQALVRSASTCETPRPSVTGREDPHGALRGSCQHQSRQRDPGETMDRVPT